MLIDNVSSGRPSADTLSVALPCFVPSTTTTSSPLKSGISVKLNATSDVASPLHAARNFAAPVTSNFILFVAVGQGVPSLSTTDTFTKEMLLRCGF